MGTEKRDRQRANRAVKQQQAARAQTRQKGSRMAIIVVGAIVGVLAIAFVASKMGNDDDTVTTITTPDEQLPATSVENGPASSDPASNDPATTGAEADVTPATGDAEVFEETGEVVPAGCPSPAGADEQTQTFDAAPPMCLDPAKSYSALVTTNKGEFTVDFDAAKAPETVNNFVFLARNKYFDDTVCHRIIPGFVVQCGDPTASGTGGPGYEFVDELPQTGEYELGSLAMANSGADTNGSQFFIITGEQGAALPPSYSLFGKVTTGFDETVKPMEAAGTGGGTPSEPVEIQSVVISTD